MVGAGSLVEKFQPNRIGALFIGRLLVQAAVAGATRDRGPPADPPRVQGSTGSCRLQKLSINPATAAVSTGILQRAIKVNNLDFSIWLDTESAALE